jgi:hypothetical protein
MSDDLTAWLTQIWDEEGRLATEAFRAGFDDHTPTGEQWGVPHVIGQHMLRHVPDVVLARIAADREILALHAPAKPPWPTQMEPGCRICATAQIWDQVANEANCRTLCLLASAHADRPGYREEWRP